MRFVLVFVIVRITCLPVGNLSPVEQLSDQLYSDVEKWSSGLERPVFVYHGLSVDVECIPSNAAYNAKNNKNGFKYTWLDDTGHTVRKTAALKASFKNVEFGASGLWMSPNLPMTCSTQQ